MNNKLLSDDLVIALNSILKTNKPEKCDEKELKQLVEECLVIRDKLVSGKESDSIENEVL